MGILNQLYFPGSTEDSVDGPVPESPDATPYRRVYCAALSIFAEPIEHRRTWRIPLSLAPNSSQISACQLQSRVDPPFHVGTWICHGIYSLGICGSSENYSSCKGLQIFQSLQRSSLMPNESCNGDLDSAKGVLLAEATQDDWRFARVAAVQTSSMTGRIGAAPLRGFIVYYVVTLSSECSCRRSWTRAGQRTKPDSRNPLRSGLPASEV
jgi:hypothetical protein